MAAAVISAFQCRKRKDLSSLEADVEQAEKLCDYYEEKYVDAKSDVRDKKLKLTLKETTYRPTYSHWIRILTKLDGLGMAIDSDPDHYNMPLSLKPLFKDVVRQRVILRVYYEDDRVTHGRSSQEPNWDDTKIWTVNGYCSLNAASILQLLVEDDPCPEFWEDGDDGEQGSYRVYRYKYIDAYLYVRGIAVIVPEQYLDPEDSSTSQYTIPSLENPVAKWAPVLKPPPPDDSPEVERLLELIDQESDMDKRDVLVEQLKIIRPPTPASQQDDTSVISDSDDPLDNIET